MTLTSDDSMAVRLRSSLASSGFPDQRAWSITSIVTFCGDWQGNQDYPDLTTEVRILWSPDTLFVRFDCRYRELWVFEDADANGRRDGLWDRDVAEAFLQPDQFGTRNYKEFEVSPNGMWVDLQISDAPRRDLKSGLKCTAAIDTQNKRWVGQLAIPMRSLTTTFDPSQTWRANFYRAEGKDPGRAYLAWRPTRTPEPQFHVPAAFGMLRFQP